MIRHSPVHGYELTGYLLTVNRSTAAGSASARQVNEALEASDE